MKGRGGEGKKREGRGGSTGGVGSKGEERKGEGTVQERMEGKKEKRKKVEGMGRGERRGGKGKNSHLMISPRNPKIPEILNINQ